MQATALPSAWLADRVMTGAQVAKDDICATLRIDPERVDVVHHGMRRARRRDPAPEALLRARFVLGDGPLVLCVAQKRAHKNLDTLVRAMALIAGPVRCSCCPAARRRTRTSCAGSRPSTASGTACGCSAGSTRAQLEGLYALATCFVLASRRKASACRSSRRCATACRSRARTLHAAGGRGRRRGCSTRPTPAIAPRSTPAGRAALAAQLAARGRARCEQLTWERTAAATLASYRRAIDQRASTSVPAPWHRARPEERCCERWRARADATPYPVRTMVARVAARSAAVRRLVALAHGDLRGEDVTIALGVAAGMRFNSADSVCGYARGTAEPAVQRALERRSRRDRSPTTSARTSGSSRSSRRAWSVRRAR